MKTSLFFVCCFFLALTSFAQQDKMADKSYVQVIDPYSFNAPLYIVDDVEFKVDSLSSTNSISQLDPNKIERIDVLKGQSAIDQYGEKGKNGVIIITTKEFAKKSKIRKE